MDILETLPKIIIGVIRAGALTRVIYCFVKAIYNHDEIDVYKRRGKNTIVFYILAESVWQIKDILFYYFRSGGAGGGGAGGF